LKYCLDESFAQMDEELKVKICSFLGCYAAWNGKSLLTFWDNLLVPSSRVKKSLEDGTDR